MSPCRNADVCAVSLQAPTLTMEGGRLRRSLQLVPGRDFETVPEPVWRALYHWYGANLSLPRPVSEYSLEYTHTYTQQLMNLTRCEATLVNINITASQTCWNITTSVLSFTGTLLCFLEQVSNRKSVYRRKNAHSFSFI